MRRLAQLSEQTLKDKPAAYGWYLKVFAEDPDGRLGARRDRAPGHETGGHQELVTAYEAAYAGDNAGGGRASVARGPAAHGWSSRASTRRISPRPTRRSRTNAKILKLDETQRRRRSPRSSACTSSTERYEELLGIYAPQAPARVRTPIAQKEIRYKVASIFESEVKDDRRRSRPTRPSSTITATELPAYTRARSHLRRRRRSGRSSRRSSRASSPRAAGRHGAVVELKFRLGQPREPPRRSQGRDRAVLATSCRSTPAITRARGRRWSSGSRTADHQLEVAAILEPDLPADRGVAAPHRGARDPAHAREDRVAAQVALLLRIGELWATKIGDGEKAFDAYDALLQAGRRERDRAPRARAARRDQRDVAAARSALYEAALPTKAAVNEPGLQRELLLKVAGRLRREARQGRQGGRVLPPRAGDRSRRPGALEALEKLYTGTSSGPSCSRSTARRWSSRSERRRARGDLLPDGLPAGRRCCRRRGGDRHLQARCWRRTAPTSRRSRPSIGSTSTRSTGTSSPTTCRGSSSSPTTRPRPSSCTTGCALLRERELGEVAAAVDTYRQVLELDVDERGRAGRRWSG